MTATLQRFFQFTFQSFWGMFGWMGVVMDVRIYQILLVFTIATASGLVAAAIEFFNQRNSSSNLRSLRLPSYLILSFSALLTATGYLWYNLSFVQHQGRYLFPALIPMGLAAGAAWEALCRPRLSRLISALFMLGSVVVFLLGSRWPALFCGLMAILILIVGLLPSRFHWIIPAGIGSALAILSIASLFLFLVPALG